jgi:hypothetical protein
MNRDLEEAQQRAVQYWFVDGWAEIAAGLVGLFVALLFLVWQVILMWRWSLPVILVAGLVVSLGLRLIVQRIKERSTYLLTGYASSPSGVGSKGSMIITAAFTLLLLVSNSYLATHGPQRLLWSPALAGSAFALLFAWTGVWTRLRRFYLLALVSLCAGIVLAVLRVDYLRGVAVLAGIAGLILLVQGYRVHRAYMSQNPPPGRPADE